MLALTRKDGQVVEVWHGGERLRVVVVESRPGLVRVAFDGAPNVRHPPGRFGEMFTDGGHPGKPLPGKWQLWVLKGSRIPRRLAPGPMENTMTRGPNAAGTRSREE
jgi:hypothetical protein